MAFFTAFTAFLAAVLAEAFLAIFFTAFLTDVFLAAAFLAVFFAAVFFTDFLGVAFLAGFLITVFIIVFFAASLTGAVFRTSVTVVAAVTTAVFTAPATSSAIASPKPTASPAFSNADFLAILKPSNLYGYTLLRTAKGYLCRHIARWLPIQVVGFRVPGRDAALSPQIPSTP